MLSTWFKSNRSKVTQPQHNNTSSKIVYQWIIYSSLFIIVVYTLGIRLLINSLTVFWQDEILLPWATHHDLISRQFFYAIKSQVSAMPWPFIEYWVYMQWLKTIPINHLMENLEFYLRLPLTIYMLAAIIAVFLMVRRLSHSILLAWLTTVFLITINYLSTHLGTELRMHTSGFMHAALSWCFLTYLLTSEQSSTAKKYFYLLCWTFSVSIAATSHIFSTYSLYVQLAIFILADNHLIPKFSTSKISPFLKTICLLFIQAFGVFSLLYFRFVLTQPYKRGGFITDSMAILNKTITNLNIQIFAPSIWLWIIGFFIFIIITFRRTSQTKERLKLSLLAFIGMLQLMMTLLLSFKYYQLGWGPDPWLGRYAMAGLLPFIFIFSYFAYDCIPYIYEQRFGGYIILIVLLYYFLNPALNGQERFEAAKKYKDINRLTIIKKEVVRYNAAGKVNYVLGLKPNETPIAQQDVHDIGVDQTWQLYTGGPFSFNKIDQPTLFGGRKALPCNLKNMLPLATGPAKEYAVDFCEEGKAILRITKP